MVVHCHGSAKEQCQQLKDELPLVITVHVKIYGCMQKRSKGWFLPCTLNRSPGGDLGPTTHLKHFHRLVFDFIALDLSLELQVQFALGVTLE